MSALLHSDSGRLRVLLVDADPLMRRVTARLIERKLGIDVIPAHGAMHALSQLRREPFHAAVIDLEMPEMGGLELLRRLESLFPEVIVGVWAGKVSPDELAGTQVRFAVEKTEPVEVLVEALREALDLERSPSGSYSRPPMDD